MRGVRKTRNAILLLVIFLPTFIVSNNLITNVIAPPIGGESVSGILTSPDSVIQITRAEVNMTIFSEPFADAYHIHVIYLKSVLNLSNPSAENETILLLYNPCWNSQYSYYNYSSINVYFEGYPLFQTNQTLTNITNLYDLPVSFHDRLPEYNYNRLYAPFLLLNLTLSSFQNLTLHLSDVITITSISINYSRIGFGFNIDQLEDDSTRLKMLMKVINSTQFLSVNCFPYDLVEQYRVQNDFIILCEAVPPFSSKLSSYMPEPVSAGFEVDMDVREYLLPTIDDSTDPTSITSTSSTIGNTTSNSTDFLLIPLLPLVFSGITWIIFIIVLYKTDPKSRPLHNSFSIDSIIRYAGEQM